jgi:hypothetical protein
LFFFNNKILSTIQLTQQKLNKRDFSGRHDQCDYIKDRIKNTKGVLIVFSLTSTLTLLNVQWWYDLVCEVSDLLFQDN